MTSLSDQFVVLHENTTDYELHNNGNVEIYRRFLFEEGYVAVICSASNIYGSAVKKFNLWEKKAFEKGSWCSYYKILYYVSAIFLL